MFGPSSGSQSPKEQGGLIMATEILRVTIDNTGIASVSKEELTVTKPTTIIWQLHPANQSDWKLLGIEFDPGFNDQFIDWTEMPNYGSISTVDVCTQKTDIKYSVLYARKHPAGPVRRLDPTIKNEPPQIIPTQSTGNRVVIPVSIDDSGSVTSPAKDDMVVITEKPPKPGAYAKQIRWELTETSREVWELVDLAWQPPGPPANEFSKPDRSSSKHGCPWIQVSDKNATRGEFRYSLIYKKRGTDELLFFDPTIKNEPPR